MPFPYYVLWLHSPSIWIFFICFTVLIQLIPFPETLFRIYLECWCRWRGVGVRFLTVLGSGTYQKVLFAEQTSSSWLVSNCAGEWGHKTNLLWCLRAQQLNATDRLSLVYKRSHQKVSAYSSSCLFFKDFFLSLDFNSLLKLLAGSVIMDSYYMALGGVCNSQ